MVVHPGGLSGGTAYNALLVDRTFSYYGADERLRVLDRRTCLMVEDRCQSAAPPQDERSSFEEHRYDALGRRVLLHARQDAFCPTCRSHVVRTVWDGDQILHEISARPSGPEMEQDVPSTLDSYAGMQSFGRVMYVHAGALDYPVAVVRSEYSDSLPNAAVLYPLSNHKGQFDMGIGVGHCASIAGRSYRLAEPIGEPRVGRDTAIDMRDFTEPIDYCVEVDWPGRNSFSTGYRRPAFGRTAPWVGSLIYHGRDPSGQMYRRNRFYDPQTGRFTQEDPIGIAGGLNVYGYAEGDPVTFSDPYGLSASCNPPTPNCIVQARLRATWTALGEMAHGAVATAGSFFPFISEGNDVATLVSGYDVLAGENVGNGGRAAAGIGLVSPIGGGKAFRTIGEAAHDLARAIGRNSVSIRTPNGLRRVDLEGRAHGGVATPHVQTYSRHTNPETGQASMSRDSRVPTPATLADIRQAREAARRQGLLDN